MSEPPDWPKRKPTRLAAFDYSRCGAYLVSICSHERDRDFGFVRDGIVALSDAGCVVAECWQELPQHYSQVVLDMFVVMPDHVHGLVIFQAYPNDYLASTCAYPLSEVIRWFKTTSAKRTNGQCNLSRRFRWQRSFHDRIVRDEHEFCCEQRYICYNPARWELEHGYR
jgi:REP element-mobilizing transposase RayT